MKEQEYDNGGPLDSSSAQHELSSHQQNIAIPVSHDWTRIARNGAIGLIVLSGLAIAIIVMSGFGSWESGATFGFVLLGSLLTIVSLYSAHNWLKITQFVSIFIVTVLSIANLFLDFNYERDCDYTSEIYQCTKNFYAYYSDALSASWIIVITLVLLGVFSRTWKFIKYNKFLKISYGLVYGLALTSSAIAFQNILSDYYDDSTSMLFGYGFAIIALTLALMVIIQAVVARNQRAREFNRQAVMKELAKDLSTNVDHNIASHTPPMTSTLTQDSSEKALISTSSITPIVKQDNIILLQLLDLLDDPDVRLKIQKIVENND